MVRAMCGVQLKDRKRSTDLMFMLGLNETIDLLAIANSVRCHRLVLRREDGHALRKALDFEIEDQRKKGRPKRTWKKQIDGESAKVGLRREDVLCRSKWNADISQNAAWLRWIWSPSHVFNIDLKHWCLTHIIVCIYKKIKHTNLTTLFLSLPVLILKSTIGSIMLIMLIHDL